MDYPFIFGSKIKNVHKLRRTPAIDIYVINYEVGTGFK